jgi:response regulator of citrate/malate metabolism
MQSVRTAMQGGALHYLIKPFDFDDLRARLTAYAELDDARSAERETHQEEVDRLFDLIRRPGSAAAITLPKGHSAATAELVLDALRNAAGPLSAHDISERVGISRATAQRYLTSLADAGKVRLQLRYGTAGRPEHRYELDRP